MHPKAGEDDLAAVAGYLVLGQAVGSTVPLPPGGRLEVAVDLSVPRVRATAEFQAPDAVPQRVILGLQL